MTAAASEALGTRRSIDGVGPSASGWSARIGVLALIFGGILVATVALPGFWADRISLAVIYAVIGLSLNVVLGYLGQVSLGHQAFIGIAAFVAAAYVTKSANCTINNCSVTNVLIAIVLAALSGAIVASLLGLVALRIRGLYLAVITLAYGFVAERSIFEIPSLTNGGAGQPAPRPNGFAGDHAYAYFCFIFLALVLFVDWRLLRSKVGRAILAIKHSEPVASTYGINVTNYKVLAFAMSGVFAGIAGALFAFHETNVVANNFNFQSALLWLLMVVVGGLGSRVGVVIGSAFFALFPFLIDKIGFISSWLTHHNRSPDYLTLVIGPALALLTIIRFPGGIAEQISPLTRWLGGKPFTMHPDTHGEAVATAGGLDEPAGDTLRDGDGTDETTEMPAGAATGLSTEGER